MTTEVEPALVLLELEPVVPQPETAISELITKTLNGEIDVIAEDLEWQRIRTVYLDDAPATLTLQVAISNGLTKPLRNFRTFTDRSPFLDVRGIDSRDYVGRFVLDAVLTYVSRYTFSDNQITQFTETMARNLMKDKTPEEIKAISTEDIIRSFLEEQREHPDRHIKHVTN